MMHEVSLPLSPKTGQCVCDWGFVIAHKPESHTVHTRWSSVSSHDYCMSET